MIDLHTHTYESDGTDSPAGLIENAARAGLTAIAITDHDTFSAHATAQPLADAHGIRLVRGVEVSTKARGRSVHLLSYWFHGAAPQAFEDWLAAMLEYRRERNRRLAARLRELGIPIELEEAEALGRTVTGRVHFAKLLIAKGYVKTVPEAFDRYIGEDAPGFILMDDPKTPDAIRKVREHGGVPVLAHPIRLGMSDPQVEEEFIREQADAGLLGLEVMHSDHDELARARYLALVERYNLSPTGGSDYHGSVKPQIHLGRGIEGNVSVPQSWLDKLSSL
ncbi:PHP domain-containing protein [Bryobacter aggregatus]|uniref:PHP domain-containing protein n=1 Tax=Bryobacter aggregatus TaxID=360054 RepID=UPI0004E1466D|nr:PHP domain-containing protein [Bryobacter aggregatus]